MMLYIRPYIMLSVLCWAECFYFVFIKWHAFGLQRVKGNILNLYRKKLSQTIPGEKLVKEFKK